MAEMKNVKCIKCGYIGEESEFPKGYDFCQMPFVAACPKCDNRQNPGDASMRMFGGPRPFEYVRLGSPTDPVANNPYPTPEDLRWQGDCMGKSFTTPGKRPNAPAHDTAAEEMKMDAPEIDVFGYCPECGIRICQPAGTEQWFCECGASGQMLDLEDEDEEDDE